MFDRYDYTILTLCEELHGMLLDTQQQDFQIDDRLKVLLDRLENWTMGPARFVAYDLAVFGLVIETLNEWRWHDVAMTPELSRLDDAVIWFREMMRAQKRANKIKQKKEAARLRRG